MTVLDAHASIPRLRFIRAKAPFVFADAIERTGAVSQPAVQHRRTTAPPPPAPHILPIPWVVEPARPLRNLRREAGQMSRNTHPWRKPKLWVHQPRCQLKIKNHSSDDVLHARPRKPPSKASVDPKT